MCYYHSWWLLFLANLKWMKGGLPPAATTTCIRRVPWAAPDSFPGQRLRNAFWGLGDISTAKNGRIKVFRELDVVEPFEFPHNFICWGSYYTPPESGKFINNKGLVLTVMEAGKYKIKCQLAQWGPACQQTVPSYYVLARQKEQQKQNLLKLAEDPELTYEGASF